MWNYLSIRFRDWIIGPRRYHLRISIRDSLRETCFRDLRGSKAKDFLGYHRRLGLSKLRGVLEYFCVWIVIRWLPVRFESENSTISKTPGHSKDTSVLVDIRNTFEIPSVFEYLNAISTYEGTLMDEHRVGEYHIAIHRSRSLTIYLSIYVSIHPCIYIYMECCINTEQLWYSQQFGIEVTEYWYRWEGVFEIFDGRKGFGLSLDFASILSQCCRKIVDF